MIESMIDRLGSQLAGLGKMLDRGCKIARFQRQIARRSGKFGLARMRAPRALGNRARTRQIAALQHQLDLRDGIGRRERGRGRQGADPYFRACAATGSARSGSGSSSNGGVMVPSPSEECPRLASPIPG